jgi:hypothetical protein
LRRTIAHVCSTALFSLIDCSVQQQLMLLLQQQQQQQQ